VQPALLAGLELLGLYPLASELLAPFLVLKIMDELLLVDNIWGWVKTLSPW
jgi:hypothetical protein